MGQETLGIFNIPETRFKDRCVISSLKHEHLEFQQRIAVNLGHLFVPVANLRLFAAFNNSI